MCMDCNGSRIPLVAEIPGDQQIDNSGTGLYYSLYMLSVYFSPLKQDFTKWIITVKFENNWP